MDGHAALTRAASPPETVELIHSLACSLEHFDDWLSQLQRAVIFGGPPPPHLSTALPWWDRAALPVGIDEQPLLRAGAELQTAAGGLLDQARAGAIAPAAYDRFLAARKALRATVQRIERDLWSRTCLLDSLTGLRNRHGMLLELREEQQRAKRESTPCLLALMDLDHFKQVNDHHGHAAGDVVLREVTRTAARRLRPYDRLYRYGGEEFLICLPQTDVAQGEGIIERLREEIAQQRVPVEEREVAVTVSFGLAAVDTEAPVEASIRRADCVLYAAKANGRNRVIAS